MQPNKLRVTGIQRLCVSDGPGVRTVVFLKGCYLHCPWCCNPEAIHYEEDASFKRGECVDSPLLCSSCILHKGNTPVTKCPYHVYEEVSNDYSSGELLDLLMKDNHVLENGGVTFSGGEPLLHAWPLKPLLATLKDKGVNIAFESTLYAPTNHFDAVVNDVDYWLVDVKFQYGLIPNRDYELEEGCFEKNLLNLQNTVSKKNITYRMVLMSEVLDIADDIAHRLLSHNIQKIELLPCHSLAENKYKQLGKSFRKFGTPTQQELNNFSLQLSNFGIHATYPEL